MIAITHCIIDTSYLLELYKVDGFFDPNFHDRVKTKFQQAANQPFRFYVTVPILFEVGNHIADVRDGNKRRQLAEQLERDVRDSLKNNSPWQLLPAVSVEFLADLLDKFTREFVMEKIGLVDSFTIRQANRLKNGHKKQFPKVHIWTKDQALKAREPDREENPLVA